MKQKLSEFTVKTGILNFKDGVRVKIIYKIMPTPGLHSCYPLKNITSLYWLSFLNTHEVCI